MSVNFVQPKDNSDININFIVLLEYRGRVVSSVVTALENGEEGCRFEICRSHNFDSASV